MKRNSSRLAEHCWLLSIVAALGIVVAAPAVAHEPVDPADVETVHPTGHVHDRADQTWPPQPRGIQNVVPLSNPGSAERVAELRQRRVTDRARIALARADVRQALGRRYSSPDLVESGSKRAEADGVARLMYFSYDNNSTVEVTVDGKQVRGLRRIRASDYQPDVTDGEIVQAEALARQYFNERSMDRVADLQAYGILAYLPQGKGFYPTRVIYMSFHLDADAPPEYAAWVDLTNRRVLRIREEQP